MCVSLCPWKFSALYKHDLMLLLLGQVLIKASSVWCRSKHIASVSSYVACEGVSFNVWVFSHYLPFGYIALDLCTHSMVRRHAGLVP